MNNKKDDFIASHPRESLQLLCLGICAIWLTPIAILGCILYLICVRVVRIDWWKVLLAGVGIAICSLYAVFKYYELKDFGDLFHTGFLLNLLLWKSLLVNGFLSSFYVLVDDTGYYVIGFSLLLAGILSTIELIPNGAHEKELMAINKARGREGLNIRKEKEKTVKQVNSHLSKLKESEIDGTLLGVSKYGDKVIYLPDDYVNQVVLVLGTTGAGKTITLRRFYSRALMAGYPLIVIDGKPSAENVSWLEGLAKANNRKFYGFNCGNYYHYDCLSGGGFTELKDKIITLKQEWSSDHYKSIAGDYLQTEFEVLLKSGEEFDLKKVVKCLRYEELALLVRKIKDNELMSRVAALKNSYKEDDITGLRAHLSHLVHSELGCYFEKNEKMFNLSNVIKENGIVYFALPALRFPDFAKVLGKLVINDLKAVIDRQESVKPIFAVFDEFSVFAGEQALNLVNMGRGKGMHSVFGTQGLADLKTISPAFESQVLNCVNTIICHRLNDQESAEKVAEWAGTKDSFDVTAQINQGQGSTGMGSVRRNKEFIVHPDDIKRSLQPGEAFLLTKVVKFFFEKIKVKYS
jgi:hypothetical protein